MKSRICFLTGLVVGLCNASSAFSEECSIKFGGGGKSSAVYSLEDNKVTKSNNLGSPWSFIRSSRGPCRFTLYNEKNYAGRKVEYGSTFNERIASKDGRDKGGWKVRSLVITPLPSRCAIALHAKPDNGIWDDLKGWNDTFYVDKGMFIFNGPSEFSNISALSGIGKTSGDSSCKYTLYNENNFAGRQITVGQVNKPFRGDWRVRSIKITNRVSHSAKPVSRKGITTIDRSQSK